MSKLIKKKGFMTNPQFITPCGRRTMSRGVEPCLQARSDGASPTGCNELDPYRLVQLKVGRLVGT